MVYIYIHVKSVEWFGQANSESEKIMACFMKAVTIRESMKLDFRYWLTIKFNILIAHSNINENFILRILGEVLIAQAIRKQPWLWQIWKFTKHEFLLTYAFNSYEQKDQKMIDIYF